jgi:hypothetical protein
VGVYVVLCNSQKNGGFSKADVVLGNPESGAAGISSAFT